MSRIAPEVLPLPVHLPVLKVTTVLRTICEFKRTLAFYLILSISLPSDFPSVDTSISEGDFSAGRFNRLALIVCLAKFEESDGEGFCMGIQFHFGVQCWLPVGPVPF
jgi:hypothetical protein